MNKYFYVFSAFLFFCAANADAQVAVGDTIGNFVRVREHYWEQITPPAIAKAKAEAKAAAEKFAASAAEQPTDRFLELTTLKENKDFFKALEGYFEAAITRYHYFSKEKEYASVAAISDALETPGKNQSVKIYVTQKNGRPESRIVLSENLSAKTGFAEIKGMSEDIIEQVEYMRVADKNEDIRAAGIKVIRFKGNEDFLSFLSKCLQNPKTNKNAGMLNKIIGAVKDVDYEVYPLLYVNNTDGRTVTWIVLPDAVGAFAINNSAVDIRGVDVISEFNLQP